MAYAPFDVSDVITVSETVLTEKYKYVVPSGVVFVPWEFSLAGNTDFETNGKWSLEIAGQVITSKGVASNEISLLKTLTIPLSFEAGRRLFARALSPGEEIKLQARVTTGTGKIQVALSGFFISMGAWELMKKEFDVVRI
jgi:hypothetical protein